MKKRAAKTTVLSKAAYRQISECMISADNRFEVGGVFLGYKFFGIYYIVAATVPAEEMTRRSRVSFVLDGEWHTARALQLSEQFRHKPSVLGVWHSHICSQAVFSEQDQRCNRQMAALYDGILSAVVTLTQPSRQINFTVYYVFPDGKEHRCRVRII